MSAGRALIEVVDIITRHGLTVDEISAALSGGKEFKADIEQHPCLFGYVGDFLFVGLAVMSACDGTTSTPSAASC
jgi:hypothetical protein